MLPDTIVTAHSFSNDIKIQITGFIIDQTLYHSCNGYLVKCHPKCNHKNELQSILSSFVSNDLALMINNYQSVEIFEYDVCVSDTLFVVRRIENDEIIALFDLLELSRFRYFKCILFGTNPFNSYKSNSIDNVVVNRAAQNCSSHFIVQIKKILKYDRFLAALGFYNIISIEKFTNNIIAGTCSNDNSNHLQFILLILKYVTEYFIIKKKKLQFLTISNMLCLLLCKKYKYLWIPLISYYPIKLFSEVFF